MSTIGQNFQADNTGDTSGSSVAASDTSATPSPAAPNAAPSLNPMPTCIVLDEPYAMGDLEPGVTYSLVYITTLYINGPALTMVATYEIGSMSSTGWAKAPLVPTQTLQVSGPELVPFFLSKATTDASPYLWDQVEALLYAQVQAANSRLKGTVEPVSLT